MASGFILIDCRYCGRKEMDAPAHSNAHSTRGCKKRLRIEWYWKTQHASVGPA